MTPPLPLLPKIAMLDYKRQFQKKTYHIFGLQGAQKTKKQFHLNYTTFLNVNHSRNANFLGHRWSWSRPSETVSTPLVCTERWYLPKMFRSHHIHNIRQFWSPKLAPVPQLKTHICRQRILPCCEFGECILNEMESHPSWSVFDLLPLTHLLLKVKYRRLAMSSPSE